MRFRGGWQARHRHVRKTAGFRTLKRGPSRPPDQSSYIVSDDGDGAAGDGDGADDDGGAAYDDGDDGGAYGDDGDDGAPPAREGQGG